jgi:hypothetical protein
VSDTLSGKTKGLAWLLKTISMQPLRKNLFSAPDSCCDSSRCSHGLSPVLSEQTHLRFLCFLLFERSHACLFPVSIHVDNPLFQHQKVLHGSGARSTKHEARSTKHQAQSTFSWPVPFLFPHACLACLATPGHHSKDSPACFSISRRNGAEIR